MGKCKGNQNTITNPKLPCRTNVKKLQSSQKDFPGKLILALLLLLTGGETGKQMFNQSKSRVVQDHSNQENPLGAQFRIALLQLDYTVFTVLNFKAPCKKKKLRWPATPNIDGYYMLCFLHPTPPAACFMRVVGSCCAKFETGQTFGYAQTDATTPNVAYVAQGLRLHYHFYLTRISLPLITLNNTGSRFVPITVWLVRKTQKQHLVTQLILNKRTQKCLLCINCGWKSME